MSSDLLAALAGILLSLACSYLPGAAGRYQALDSTQRRLVMLALLVFVTLAVFGLACAGWQAEAGLGELACDAPTAAGLVRALVAAVVANQAAYQLTPPARRSLAGGG